MKKELTTMCLAMLALASMAGDGNIIVYMSDNSAASTFALTDVSSIRFDSNGFAVNTVEDGVSEFEYADVRSIKFTDFDSGVDALAGDGAQLRAYYHDGYIYADGWQQGHAARAAVYGLDGTVRITVDDWDGTPIATDCLDRGIYVFSVENSNIKFIKQ